MKLIKRLAQIGTMGLALLFLPVNAQEQFAKVQFPSNYAPASRLQQNSRNAEIEDIMKSFPKEIPGASSINKYPQKGAEYLLIHILNAHNGTYRSGALDKEDPLYQYVSKVQEENYSILTNLFNILPDASFHGEGLTAQVPSEREYNQKTAKMQGMSLSEYAKEEAPMNCVMRYHLSHGVKICKTEDAAALRAAYDALENKLPLEDNIKTVMDSREDAVLKNLTNRVSILVFGGDHRFGGKESCGAQYRPAHPKDKDNLARFSRKFSLIEITPASYNELPESNKN